jgi:DsbC/DsbD-like thiol-disulfide interchange protein
MDRRIFISALMSLPLIAPARAAVPWSASFIVGGFDGKTYKAALLIDLDPGWKTYWRNPGTSGIPPDITAAGENLESMSIDFPMPVRIVDEGGETLGFHDEVMFILNLKPKDPAKPLRVDLSSFFGVCQKICTPAKFDGTLDFAPSSTSNAEASDIAEWQNQVPRPANIVSSAKVKDKILTLQLKQEVKDIFIEGPERYYFRAPKFNLHGDEASFIVDGLKKSDDLIGAELRLTINAMGMGLEQRVTVA